MKTIFTAGILLFTTITFAQPYPVKETYDDFLENNYTAQQDYTNASLRPCCWIAWGDVLTSYLNMFEATGDKAYLNKFAKHAYAIQQLRTGATGNFPFFWDMSLYGICASTSITNSVKEQMSFHYTGRMLLPMARYTYLVKNLYPALQSEPVLPGMVSDPGIVTFDDLADYLIIRLEQTLDYTLGHYYMNNIVGFSKTDWHHSPYIVTLSELNQQASWGCSLLYCSISDAARPSYITYGQDISAIFKSELISHTNSPGINSYQWYHNRTVTTSAYGEDVSHGATDLRLALVGYELYGSALWTTTELNTLAHTFTYNIWDRSSAYWNGVFSMNYGLSPATSCIYSNNADGNFYGNGEILDWMPLYKWDDPSAGADGIYELLKEQTENLMNSNGIRIPTGYIPTCRPYTCELSGSQTLSGLTEVVRAQWDQECVNLTLRNRHLVYNQDFNIKNILIIDPASSGTIPGSTVISPSSFADPVITTPEFIIDNGVRANFTAGEYIELRPGFYAMAGSVTELSIVPSNCSDGMRHSGYISNPDEAPSIQKDHVKQQVFVYPNPSTGLFTFTTSGDMSYDLAIFSELGIKIKEEKNRSGKVEIDLSNIAKGLYYYKVSFSDGQPVSGKLVLN
jgi:hypothetical protein